MHYVHCPARTKHVFIGAGRGPCVILMAGARRPGWKVTYPVSRLAQRHGAGVAKRATSVRVAYAGTPRWTPARVGWERLGLET